MLRGLKNVEDIYPNCHMNKTKKYLPWILKMMEVQSSPTSLFGSSHQCVLFNILKEHVGGSKQTNNLYLPLQA